MRRKNETATSFNQLKEITQAIQAQKNSAQTSDNANTSELTHKHAPKHKGAAHAKNSAPTSDNANTSEIASQSTPKPKRSAHAKNSALKPTKKAFSERQIATIRDNSHASAKESKGGVNA
ncbi:hypothetical protein [Helicobacter pylori]|uniref:hypothetical protein n=1 Tax=Helicobacter pylori TaxID=210 RepID=UPI001E45CBDB|nr:hypothetical protein [Helicobacter pylori]